VNREQFLTWSEDILRPCALPGALPCGSSPYRSVRVAPRQYLGIDALQDGLLRVYLYSNRTPHKTRWLQLRDALLGPQAPPDVRPLPPEAHTRLFARDNGEEHRGFFGFEWKGARDLAREQAPLSQYVSWLVLVARGG
jgi:hypothetical protein